jgi:hypothetical protein
MCIFKSTAHINQFSLTHIYIIYWEQKFPTYRGFALSGVSWFQLTFDKKDFLYLPQYMASHPSKQ